MAKINFEDDMVLDPDALDVAWTEQAAIFAKYARLSAKAETRVRRLHERVKVVRSEIVLKVSKSPERYLGKGVRCSDPKVEAYYRTDEKYIAAKDDLVRAQHTAELLRLAVSACHQRRAALEGLCGLLQMEYFAGPRMPRNIKEEVAQRKISVNARIKKKVKA